MVTRPHKIGTRQFISQRREAIASEVRDGASMASTAVKHRVHIRTVVNACRQHGVSSTHRGWTKVSERRHGIKA